ncbi:hypothetical protein [Rubinisphaera sp.]|uniref:hypothetical protein n=1 Tax=Rubinisphaera sp. TaxID=2024857 RepID=UPI000C0DBD45|nr:hypothetical protein [Rubinisphaera sp.]MBV09065.1 hypothetical protein [Rubinisphaera sp.]HCS53077.1 hypothetical protein [Planctomycetaceae bacterium]
MALLFLFEVILVSVLTYFVWTCWRFRIAVYTIPLLTCSWSVFLYSLCFFRDGSGTPGQLLGFAVVVSLFLALPFGLVWMMCILSWRRATRTDSGRKSINPVTEQTDTQPM